MDFSFSGRKVAIATMHIKERVIAPIISSKLGLDPFVPEMNTDALGTFSGEIERVLSPLAAARKKCEIAMEISGCDLAISSEGSFGAHPYIFFAKADDELVVLIDRKNDLEIVGRELSTKTNHDGTNAFSVQDALDFAYKIGFPQHGIILKDHDERPEKIFKDLSTEEKLNAFLTQWFNDNESIWLESDLRAMNNPTRMQVIEKAVLNLVEKVKSTCPMCDTPGFWVTEAIPGLKCSLCQSPTQSTLAHKYQCQKCNYESLKEYPNNKREEEPMYCDFCNP